MIKIERYIAKHVLISTVIILIGLTILISLFTLLTELSNMRMNYQYYQVMIYIMMTMPGVLLQVLPFSCLVGAITGLGMLVNHNELMVIRISGISRFRICSTTIKSVLILVVIGMLLGEFVIPKLQYEAEIKRTTERLRDSNQIKTGVWWRDYNDYIHINNIMDNKLNGVQILSFNDQHQLKKTVYAKYAVKDKQQWTLKELSTITYLQNETKKTTAKTELWDINLNTRLLQMAMTVPKYLSIRDLFTYIQHMKNQHAKIHYYQLSLYNKLFYPLTIISLLLIGISFVFGPLRSATTGKRLFAGIITSILFMLLQKVSGPASIVFGFSPLLAVLCPIVIIFIISLLLLKRIH